MNRQMVTVVRATNTRHGNTWWVCLKDGGKRLGMIMQGSNRDRWGYRMHGFDSKPHNGFRGKEEAVARLLLKLNGM